MIYFFYTSIQKERDDKIKKYIFADAEMKLWDAIDHVQEVILVSELAKQMIGNYQMRLWSLELLYR
jgi:hypothetical protein